MNPLNLILKPCDQFLFNYQSFSPSEQHSCCNSKAAQCGLVLRQHTSIMASVPSRQQTPATTGKVGGSKCEKQKHSSERGVCFLRILCLRVMGMRPPLRSLWSVQKHIAILDPKGALNPVANRVLAPGRAVCPLETFVKKSTLEMIYSHNFCFILLFFFKEF